MTTQLNPFQAPAEGKSVQEASAPTTISIDFKGSLSRMEFDSVERIVNGSKNWSAQIGWLLFAGAVLVAIFFDSIVFGELDYLLENSLCFLGCALVAIVYLWQRHQHRRTADHLFEKQEGIFQSVRGQFRNNGLTFWANGGYVPVDYEWDDFVGYRHQDSVIALYVDFPGEMNFLSASRFDSASTWQQVVEIVSSYVPEIPENAKLAPRPTSEKQRLVKKASNLLSQNQWLPSLEAWKEVLEIEPRHASALIGRAVCYVARGQNDEALESIERAVQVGAEDRTTLLLRANLLAERGEFKPALADLTTLLDRNPKDGELYRDRGLVHLKMHSHELALADTDRALELVPDDPIAHNNRGVILIELGRFDEATESLSRSTELDPSFDRPKEHLEKIPK